MSSTTAKDEIRLRVSEQTPSDPNNTGEYDLLEDLTLYGIVESWPEKNGSAWQFTAEVSGEGETILTALKDNPGSFIMSTHSEKRCCVAQVVDMTKQEDGKALLRIEVEAEPSCG